MNNHKHKKLHCLQGVAMSMVKFSTSFENISTNGGFFFVSNILDALPEMSLCDMMLLGVSLSPRNFRSALTSVEVRLLSAEGGSSSSAWTGQDSARP